MRCTACSSSTVEAMCYGKTYFLHDRTYTAMVKLLPSKITAGTLRHSSTSFPGSATSIGLYKDLLHLVPMEWSCICDILWHMCEMFDRAVCETNDQCVICVLAAYWCPGILAGGCVCCRHCCMCVSWRLTIDKPAVTSDSCVHPLQLSSVKPRRATDASHSIKRRQLEPLTGKCSMHDI